MTFNAILAVLEDDEADGHAVLERAVAFAERDHARLTLLASAHRGWLACCAGGADPLVARALPPTQEEFDRDACERLKQAVEGVPDSISVTTRIMREHPGRTVQRLAREGEFDLAVVGARLCGREARTRRLLSRLAIPVLVVPRARVSSEHAGAPAPVPAPALTRSSPKRLGRPTSA